MHLHDLAQIYIFLRAIQGEGRIISILSIKLFQGFRGLVWTYSLALIQQGWLVYITRPIGFLFECVISNFYCKNYSDILRFSYKYTTTVILLEADSNPWMSSCFCHWQESANSTSSIILFYRITWAIPNESKWSRSSMILLTRKMNLHILEYLVLNKPWNMYLFCCCSSYR